MMLTGKRKKTKRKSPININSFSKRSKTKIREIRKSKKDLRTWKEERKKRWIWKMQQGSSRENGNGFRMLVNS